MCTYITNQCLYSLSWTMTPNICVLNVMLGQQATLNLLTSKVFVLIGTKSFAVNDWKDELVWSGRCRKILKWKCLDLVYTSNSALSVCYLDWNCWLTKVRLFQQISCMIFTLYWNDFTHSVTGQKYIP